MHSTEWLYKLYMLFDCAIQFCTRIAMYSFLLMSLCYQDVHVRVHKD